MPEMSWEHNAEARAALTAIVSDYGVATLSSPRTMSNLLKDLLSDAPRERTVLVAAAEAGLAEALRDHVAQGMDSDTAVRLTASTFSASTSITPEACSWAAGEFAIAMGISEGGAAGTPLQVSPGLSFGQAPTQGPMDAVPPGFAAAPPPAAPVFSPPEPVVSPPPPAAPPPGQFAPGQFPPGPVQSGPVQSGPVQSGPVQSGAFQSGPIQSGPVQPAPGQFSPGPQYAPGFVQPQPGYPMQMMPQPKNNNMAIASLICGVAQFVLWIAFLVPGLISAILALIFGLVSMRQLKRTGEGGRGMAVTGVVLGALGLLGGIILIVLIIIGAVLGSHSSSG